LEISCANGKQSACSTTLVTGCRSIGYLLDTIHSRIERRPDVLESVVWDAEAQKLSGPALGGFVVSEVKARTV
jgi:hypothetical protein